VAGDATGAPVGGAGGTGAVDAAGSGAAAGANVAAGGGAAAGIGVAVVFGVAGAALPVGSVDAASGTGAVPSLRGERDGVIPPFCRRSVAGSRRPRVGRTPCVAGARDRRRGAVGIAGGGVFRIRVMVHSGLVMWCRRSGWWCARDRRRGVAGIDVAVYFCVVGVGIVLHRPSPCGR
jgi:hypothetical protein